jgi:exonuclease SbcD
VVVDLGEVTEVRIREVPRTVELVRIPKRGAAPLDEILQAIDELPALADDEDPELRPLLEVAVLLTKPEPQLRARLDHAATGKRPRLVRFTTTRAGSGAALGDTSPGVALAELSPRDVLVQRWRRDHQGEPPPALLAAFDALVERVQS